MVHEVLHLDLETSLDAGHLGPVTAAFRAEGTMQEVHVNDTNSNVAAALVYSVANHLADAPGPSVYYFEVATVVPPKEKAGFG